MTLHPPLLRRIAVAAVCASASLSPAATFAQSQPPARTMQDGVDAGRLAASKRMLLTAGIIQQFDAILPLMMQQFRQMALRNNADKAQTIDDVFAKATQKFAERKDELVSEIAILYARSFTVSELDDISAFYQSATGMKFKQILPQIMQQSFAAGQAWGQKIGKEIEAEITKELSDRGIRL